MKKNFISIIAIVFLGIMIVGCTQLETSSGKLHTLNVSATGTVDLEPNLALVRIGVHSQSSDVAEAFEDNNSKADAILQTLMELGVAKEDIRTSNFSIYSQRIQPPREEESWMPEEDIVTEEAVPEEGEILEEALEEDSDDDTVLTYFVENTVSVTVRDLDSLGEILTAVVEEGANTIYGVTFDIEDKEAAIEEARQKAIADAQAQAAAIAETAGVNLGAIQSININESEMALPKYEAYAMEEAAQASGGSVPISSGTLKVRVTVDISYEIN
jgi:uncharacterized protein